MFVEYLVEVWLTCCYSYRFRFIFITIYGIVCAQLAHLSIGDWKDISSAHVIIIVKSEVSTFPIVFIFFRGCVPKMYVTSYSVTIYIRENREFVFISIVQFMMSVNSRTRFGLRIVFVCLYITPSHYHHCANFIWRHWTYKMPLSCPLYNMWGCVFSVYPFPLWWLRKYIYFVLLSSSTRKYELLPIV